MSDDDDACLVDHDRLAKAKLPDGGGDSTDGLVVNARIVFVGADRSDWAQFDFHDRMPPCVLLFSCRSTTSRGRSVVGWTGKPRSVPVECHSGEPTKKATRGLRPRMALVSLADVIGADQTPMSPADSDSIIPRRFRKKKPRFQVVRCQRHRSARLRHRPSFSMFQSASYCIA